MKFLFSLLFTLFFSVSSLFSASSGDCVDLADGSGSYILGTLLVNKTSMGKAFDVSIGYILYPYDSSQIMYSSSKSGPVSGSYTYSPYQIYTKGSPCTVCSPISQYTVQNSQSMCSGTIIDTQNLVSGVLSWQDCDSTCYITEPMPLSCDDIQPIFMQNCDTSKNNFSFQCNTVNGVANVDTKNTWCKPKSNPCDDLFQRVEATCTDNQVITGYDECRHDGINVLNPEVIKCVDNNSSENPAHQKPWDCTSYFHKSWDDSSKTCSCSSGYELSLYGSCKKSLDTNATQAEKDSADKLAKDDALNKDKMENDRNSSIEQNRHLSNIDNTLSHISRDLNTSNSLLGSVKDSISDLSSKFDSNGSSGISFNPTDSMNQLKDNYSSIYSSIDNIKSILANGLVNPIPSGSGNTCAYSHTIEGNGITVPVTFDPCTVVHPYYSTLYNIWYFLFFVAFLAFSIKLLLISRGD